MALMTRDEFVQQAMLAAVTGLAASINTTVVADRAVKLALELLDLYEQEGRPFADDE